MNGKLSAVLVLGALSLSAQSYTYKVIEQFQPNGINRQGVIVGQGGAPVQAYYRFDGFFTTVVDPSVPNSQTVLTGINAPGTIVGYSVTADGAQNRGFFLRGGVFQTITVNGAIATPSGINDSGDIVGSYGADLGFVLVNGTLKLLPYQAIGINNRGDVVGNLTNGEAYLLHAGQVTTIHYPGATDTTAAAINDSGVIVGTAGFGYVLSNGIYTQIKYPDDAFFTNLNGINDAGQITGFSIGPEGLTAFIGTPSSAATLP